MIFFRICKKQETKRGTFSIFFIMSTFVLELIHLITLKNMGDSQKIYSKRYLQDLYHYILALH
jgi:hypothetical protein